jgi:hypothetical protein
MAAPSSNAVKLLRERLKDYGIDVSTTTALDTMVAVRTIIADGKVATAAEQQSLVIRAIVPIKQLILESSYTLGPSWDAEEWSAILWDSFTACNTKTVNGKICLTTADDEQLWSFIVEQALGETHETTETVTGPWWLTRRMVVLGLFVFFIMQLIVLWTAALAGRYKFYLLLLITSTLVCSDLWRRYGKEQLWASMLITSTPTSPAVPACTGQPRNDDEVSVHTASSQLLRENEALKAELEAARRQPLPPAPPPAGAPPLPNVAGGATQSEVQNSQLDALRTFASGNADISSSSAALFVCSSCAAIQAFTSAFCSACGAALHADSSKPPDKPNKKTQFEIVYEPGTHIIFKDLKTPEELNGTDGTVVEAQGDGKYTVSSHTGALLKGLSAKNLVLRLHVSTPADNNSYAPMSSNYENLQRQAKLLRMLLENRAAQAATNPKWSEQYWNEVASIESTEGLNAAMKAVLQGHGYLGAGSKSAPRVEQLTKALRSFEATGSPAHGVAAQLFEQLANEEDLDQSSDIDNWHSQLPTDMNRAGPEIYRSIRSSGCGSVRDWVCQLFPADQRNTPTFTDLFSAASMIDFRLAKEAAERDKIKVLSTCDMCEVSLRRLAAFLHLKRTGDAAASTHMLAIKAPGTMTDVAPTWLVSESSTHSKAEHQRGERAKAQKGGGKAKSSTSTSSTTKGGAKGKKGGKGAGSKGAAAEHPSG